MQASAGARKYAGEAFLRHLISAAVEAYPHIPVVMHQDHGQSPAVCMARHQVRLHLGDDGRLARWQTASRSPATSTTSKCRKKVVEVRARDRRDGRSRTGRARLARDHEGRQGRRPRRRRHDDPRAAADRRRAGRRLRARRPSATRWRSPSAPRTAPTSSRASRPATSWRSTASSEIHARIPNTHLVMHGSSSVPQELLADIREFGGDMKETYGVPVEEIQEGIKHGVRKINIDTDIRLAMTGAIRQLPFREPGQVRPARLPEAGPPGGDGRSARRVTCPSAAKARPARSSRCRWKKWPSATKKANFPRSCSKLPPCNNCPRPVPGADLPTARVTQRQPCRRCAFQRFP